MHRLAQKQWADNLSRDRDQDTQKLEQESLRVHSVFLVAGIGLMTKTFKKAASNRLRNVSLIGG
ncbi:MAG TPA: hypothetical protein VMV88_06380 [Gallionella sp.]|nr:hypothetical protein [Gallionella sp.]